MRSVRPVDDDLAEQSVALATGSGRERHLGARSGLQAPQPVDLERLAVLVRKRSQLRAGAGIEDIDPAIAEMADQQIAGEGAEAGGSNRQTPGCIQRIVRDQLLHELSVLVEDIDIAQAELVDLVV